MWTSRADGSFWLTADLTAESCIMTNTVSIPCQEVTLEGRFLPGTAGPGVVITHPHPLFGGSMDNNVVWTAERAFHSRGWATLCFNFRGVGRSTGTYGQGEAEAEDVAAALDFLRERTPGPLFLAGYSFGAFVAGRALLQGLAVQAAVFISPPIAFMDLSWLPRVPGLRLVVAGDQDNLCPLADLRQMLAGTAAAPEIRVIAGADHFFGGREGRAFSGIAGFFAVGADLGVRPLGSRRIVCIYWWGGRPWPPRSAGGDACPTEITSSYL